MHCMRFTVRYCRRRRQYCRGFIWAGVILVVACSMAGAFTWDVGRVTPNTASYSPSLAIGSDGVPHISYYDKSGLKMRHSYRSEGVWKHESIQDMGG